MEYKLIKTFRFDEWQIVKGFINEKAEHIISQITDLDNGKMIIEEHESIFTIPTQLTFKSIDGETNTYDEHAKVSIVVSVGYYPNMTEREYLFVLVHELVVKSDVDFTIDEREDDPLLCKVEDAIYYVLRGMFLERFGK